MKAIIVDDEPKARSLLANLIKEHIKVVEIVAEAENVKEAVKLINKHQPELIFLDIEMPNENGFVLFEYFENPNFATVFCTAYSEYALQAFEVSAADYLLKPLSLNKLKEAIEKAIKNIGQNKISQKIDVLRENIAFKQLQKIGLPLADGLSFVKVDDIMYFEADGSYTHVITKNEKYLVSKKLKEFDDLLDADERFFRVHRSFLINISQIKKYSKKDGATLVFDNNKVIPVAREKKNDFDEFISSISV